MAAWIFQSNSSTVDLDGYLASTPGVIAWPIVESNRDVQPGDTTYLWRIAPDQSEKLRSGIIASAKVIDIEGDFSDNDAAAFWLQARPDLSQSSPCLWLQIERTANKKEELRSDWLREDPQLRRMRIFSGDNSLQSAVVLSELEELRIAKMWSSVGQDWTRNESLAGLWAYVATYQGTISRLEGGPVERVSQITGRAISGVYNKVMNFRAIDPRDSRKGMSGAGLTDKHLWAEYFNTQNQTLNEQAIREEFARVWGGASTSSSAENDVPSEHNSFEREVQKLAKRSLEELLKAYHRQEQHTPQARTRLPAAKARTITQYERNPLVVAITKRQAHFQCEVADCRHELFKDAGDENYCEVHHITPLAEGGADDLGNVVCLCPAHHREAHFGIHAKALKIQFMELRAKLR